MNTKPNDLTALASQKVERRINQLRSQYKLTGIAKVYIHFNPKWGDETRDYFVFESEVATFVTATLELYVDPGINPGNSEKPSSVFAITFAVLAQKSPYWWSTPGLKNYDPTGASILEWTSPQVAWNHSEFKLPDYLLDQAWI